MASSKYLNTVLTVIAVLLGLNLWTGMHSGDSAAAALDPATPAHAQGRTDAGQQRAAIIDNLEEVVASVDALGSKLDAMTNRSGQVRVEVEAMPDAD